MTICHGMNIYKQLPMRSTTRQKHKLRLAFKGKSPEQIEALIDGVLPMSMSQIDAVLASSWFRSLNKSARALYVCTWFHHVANGSNQHKMQISMTSTRFATETACMAIRKAAA